MGDDTVMFTAYQVGGDGSLTPVHVQEFPLSDCEGVDPGAFRNFTRTITFCGGWSPPVTIRSMRLRRKGHPRNRR